MNWQRANIVAAANFLRERMSHGDDSPRLRAVYEGLLEVLDPTRRVVRHQREMASAAKGAQTLRTERRRGADRRGGDRRKVDVGPPGGAERRSGRDRRGGGDRRRT